MKDFQEALDHFWKTHPNSATWGIRTEAVHIDDVYSVIKATITSGEHISATAHSDKITPNERGSARNAEMQAIQRAIETLD